jgi:hypothetical protein
MARLFATLLHIAEVADHHAHECAARKENPPV